MPAVVSGLVLAAAVARRSSRRTPISIELDVAVCSTSTRHPASLMLVSLFLGVVAAVIIGVIVRRNRRIRLNEQEELARTASRELPRES